MVPTFYGSFWKSWGKVSVVDDILSSHEQEIYPTTSLVENCIDFEFQLDRNHYVNLRQTYLVLQLKLVKGSGYEFSDEISEALLSEPFFTRRMKLLIRPDGFMLYGKLGVDFFSNSELLYPTMQVRLRGIRAIPRFYMISDNPKGNLGIVDCSLHTRRIALLGNHHTKRVEIIIPREVQFFGDSGKDFSHSRKTESIHSTKKTFTMLQFV